MKRLGEGVNTTLAMFYVLLALAVVVSLFGMVNTMRPAGFPAKVAPARAAHGVHRGRGAGRSARCDLPGAPGIAPERAGRKYE
jgi:hypothetical protein